MGPVLAKRKRVPTGSAIKQTAKAARWHACPQSHLAKKAWETPCRHLVAHRRTRWRLHIVMYILRRVRRGVQCCRDKGPGAQVPAWWPHLHPLGIAALPGLAKDHTFATHLPSCLGLAALDHLGICSVMQRQGKSHTRWPPCTCWASLPRQVRQGIRPVLHTVLHAWASQPRTTQVCAIQLCRPLPIPACPLLLHSPI